MFLMIFKVLRRDTDLHACATSALLSTAAHRVVFKSGVQGDLGCQKWCSGGKSGVQATKSDVRGVKALDVSNHASLFDICVEAQMSHGRAQPRDAVEIGGESATEHHRTQL